MSDVVLIVPKEYRSSEIGLSGKYACPLCRVQDTDSKVDIGWVECPMLEGKMICVGCCIDYQAIVSPQVLESGVYDDEFAHIGQVARKSIDELREICLSHQIETCQIIKSKPENRNNDRLQSHAEWLDSLPGRETIDVADDLSTE